MAFDLISGTISTVSLATIIIVAVLLYMQMMRDKKVVQAQMDEVIKQINDGQTFIYGLTKQQRAELQKVQDKNLQIAKDVNDMKIKIDCVRCPNPQS